MKCFIPFLFTLVCFAGCVNLWVACSQKPKPVKIDTVLKFDTGIYNSDSLQKRILLKLDSIDKYTTYRFKKDSFAILYYRTGKEKYRLAANRLIDSINRYASKY